MGPGLRLRQVRQQLGLTYRDVERSSMELAALRHRPEFVLHISRLAEIENRSAVPSLYKLYTLAVIYHIDPLDIFRWYDIPLNESFADATSFPTPHTHFMAPSASPRLPLEVDPGFDPERTELLKQVIKEWRKFEGALISRDHHRYGYIGLSDRRMSPILRPGIVLVDVSVRRMQDINWVTEYDRPIYFVELHDGYRCGWFQQDGARLVMQPHPLSRCVPESWNMPSEAEIVGRVVGLVTRLTDSPKIPSGEFPGSRAHSSRKAP